MSKRNLLPIILLGAACSTPTEIAAVRRVSLFLTPTQFGDRSWLPTHYDNPLMVLNGVLWTSKNQAGGMSTANQRFPHNPLVCASFRGTSGQYITVHWVTTNSSIFATGVMLNSSGMGSFCLTSTADHRRTSFQSIKQFGLASYTEQ
jgi:hypothetical protein